MLLDREEIGGVGPPRRHRDGGRGVRGEQAAAVSGHIKEFRERTRDQRIDIARELEHRTGRKVAWGVQVGERRELFTTLRCR